MTLSPAELYHTILPVFPTVLSLLRSYLRGDEVFLQGPGCIVHCQAVPAVGQSPLQAQLDHVALEAMEVPKTAGGQVVRALQP